MSDTDKLILQLQTHINDCVIASVNRFGISEIEVSANKIEPVVKFLRDEPELNYNMLVDLLGIDYQDYPDQKSDRFSVVYHLKSLKYGTRLSLRVRRSEAKPDVPTISHIYKNADWLEREVYDQFGINFPGHKNMRRILNHHQFVGHPLRKDYPITRRQPLSISDSLKDQMDARLKEKGYI
jgi:NADH/F420H2 dehydrogenase subunit C